MPSAPLPAASRTLLVGQTRRGLFTFGQSENPLRATLVSFLGTEGYPLSSYFKLLTQSYQINISGRKLQTTLGSARCALTGFFREKREQKSGLFLMIPGPPCHRGTSELGEILLFHRLAAVKPNPRKASTETRVPFSRRRDTPDGLSQARGKHPRARDSSPRARQVLRDALRLRPRARGRRCREQRASRDELRTSGPRGLPAGSAPGAGRQRGAGSRSPAAAQQPSPRLVPTGSLGVSSLTFVTNLQCSSPCYR